MVTLHLEFAACRKRKVINIFFACLLLQGILILYKESGQRHKQNENIMMQSNPLNNISTGCDKISKMYQA